ncbi:MAG: hypothetical protein WC030_01955 [Candidatus Paceibacterota bacterium]
MNNKNLPLIIGIALPLIFIIVLSVAIFAPAFFVTPAHNFIYSSDRGYYGGEYYQNAYTVVDGRIVLDPIPQRSGTDLERKVAPPLYLYDVETDAAHEITLAEAATYTVVVGPSSPDGYTVSYEYGHNGIFELFGSDSGNTGYFVAKDSKKKKLSGLTTADRYSGDGFKLIGWIK